MSYPVNGMENNVEKVAGVLRNDAKLCDEVLVLALGDCTLCLRSNCQQLIDRLGAYFSAVTTTIGAVADIDIVAVDSDVLNLGLEFADWAREPGKKGRKDAYVDLPDGRLILKVRTGMLFLQCETHKIAAGPCLAHDNQVINFINSQYMNWLQQRDWRICHAAAVVRDGSGLAIAGFSGGGKSTLMLHFLDDDGLSYLTNDRLFVRKNGSLLQAAGIPKLPRINPGTIVNNPKLFDLIPKHQREVLLRLPRHELWALEEKYDVQVDQVYGAGRMVFSAPLSAFLVLNWQPDSDRTADIRPVNLSERRDLLGAIMKSPGPFYQYADGSFYQDQTPLDEQAYLDILEGVSVYEACGRIDFKAIKEICLETMLDWS